MHDGLPMRLPVAVRGFDAGAARVRYGEFPMHLPIAVLDRDAGAIRVRRDDLPMRLVVLQPDAAASIVSRPLWVTEGGYMVRVR